MLTLAAVHGAPAHGAVLEEVIVTAQKREQTLQEVPASVMAMSSEAFETFVSGGVSIKALAARAPSLNVDGNSGRFLPQFYIRGLGNADFDVNANQPVSVVLDDVSLESTTLRSIPLFDVAQVEVLNGPQGTLFGRNTNAGIVKIDSAKPTLDNEGRFRASYGSRGGRNLEFAISGPLSDAVSSRLSLYTAGQDDWIDNTFNGAGDDLGGYEEYGVRLQFLAEPNDSSSMLLKLHGTKVNSNSPVFYGNSLTPGVEGTRPGFDEEVVSQDGETAQQLDHFGMSFKLEYDFPALTLVSITSYDTVESFSQADVDGGVLSFDFNDIGALGRQVFFNVHTGDGFDDHYQVSQELRLAADADNLFYQFGVYFFKESLLIRSQDFTANTTTFVDQQTTSYAVFGQVEYDFSNSFSVTGGVRYTNDDKDLETIDVLFPATIGKQDSYVSWDVAGNYYITDDLTVFGRVAQGSRGPVTLGRFGFTSTAETETLTSFEAGLKADLADGTARWNATVYTYEIDAHQLTAVGQLDNTNRLLNADSTRGYGFETNFDWLATENFQITSNLSYNKTEIRDGTLSESICGASPSCTALDPVRSVDPGPFGSVTNVIVDGNPLPLSPEWIFNLGLSYSRPTPTGELYFNTDWNYKAESNVFLYEAVEFVAESRWMGGLSVGWRHQDSGLDVAVVGRNITDEVVVFNGLAFLNLASVVTEPRYFGVEVSYDFF